jgi:large conductance mechanosensitive channel
MLKEFKNFALKGNFLDLAVGIIMGLAFGTVVASLVTDIIMPPIGALFGGVDFNNYFIVLSGGSYTTLAEAQEAGAATLNYGKFINTIINFVIVAFAMFMIVRAFNKLRKAEAPAAVTTKDCPFCATAIPLNAARSSELYIAALIANDY